MIKHFMTDYTGLLAYSDWLRDEGREEEAIAFLNAVAEERGWSEGLVSKNGNGSGDGSGAGSGYGYGSGYSYSYGNGDGYGNGMGNGNGYGCRFI